MNAQVLDSVKKDMEHTLDALRKELVKVRTGRASTALIENVLTYENSADAGLAWGIARRF